MVGPTASMRQVMSSAPSTDIAFAASMCCSVRLTHS